MTEYWPCLLAAVCAIAVLRCAARQRHGMRSLLAGAVCGLGALALGYPFLTSHMAHLTLPLVGDIHISSAMFFDLGVFALVVGSTLLILTAIAHQSVRSHRHHARLREEEQQALAALVSYGDTAPTDITQGGR